MKLRRKGKPGSEACSSAFNIHGIGEIIVTFDDGSASSEFLRDYEVFLESKDEWKDLRQALKDHDVITDNYNSHFFEPPTEEDRQRGYTL